MLLHCGKGRLWQNTVITNSCMSERQTQRQTLSPLSLRAGYLLLVGHLPLTHIHSHACTCSHNHAYTLTVMLTIAHTCRVMFTLPLSYTYTHNHVYTCLAVMLAHAHTPGQGHLLPAVAVVSTVCRPQCTCVCFRAVHASCLSSLLSPCWWHLGRWASPVLQMCEGVVPM